MSLEDITDYFLEREGITLDGNNKFFSNGSKGKFRLRYKPAFLSYAPIPGFLTITKLFPTGIDESSLHFYSDSKGSPKVNIGILRGCLPDYVSQLVGSKEHFCWLAAELFYPSLGRNIRSDSFLREVTLIPSDSFSNPCVVNLIEAFYPVGR